MQLIYRLTLILFFILTNTVCVAGVAENKQTDKEHMEAIRQALFQYHDQHGELPQHLSDLVPDYLEDKSILLSPADNEQHNTGTGAFPDPKLPCSYCYEFNHHGKKEERSSLKTKYAQMEVFGDCVPILRCFCYRSDAVLNLSYGGDWYESALFWESSPAVKEMLKKAGRNVNPQDGITFIVRCLDEQKQALPGVKLLVQNRSFQNLPLPEVTVEADAKGEAHVPLGPDGKSPGSVVFTMDGYAADDLQWDEMDAKTVMDARFYKAQSIGGVVRNAAGNGIPEAHVSIYASVKEGDGWVEKSLGERATDAEGKWTYPSLAPQAKNLSLGVRAEGYFKQDRFNDGTAQTALDETALRAGTLEITLPPAANVWVKLDAEVAADAVLKCTVCAAFSPDGEVSDSASVEQLKAREFTPQLKFPVTEPGDLWMLVLPETYAPCLKRARVLGKDVTLQVPLQAGRKVTGLVVDAKGKPVANTRITIQSIGKVAPAKGPEIATTDDAGKFHWDHAPADVYVNLMATNGDKTTEFLLAPDSADVSVTLEK